MIDPLLTRQQAGAFPCLEYWKLKPSKLMDYIEALELSLGTTAVKNFLPMQPGDVPLLRQNVPFVEVLNFSSTPINEGVAKFIQ